MKAMVVLGLLAGCSFQGATGTEPDGPPPPPPPDAMPDSPFAKCPSYQPVAGAPETSRYFTLAVAKPPAIQQLACAQEGGHLVVIDSALEAAAVNAFAVKHNGYFWIGLGDAVVENSWMTAKLAQASYLAWANTEPNGGIIENCVLQSNAGFHDFSCGYAFPAVCECD